MPRDVSLSDSKCWNGGQKWVKEMYFPLYADTDKETLKPGAYDFPFAFNLPPNIPPSFTSHEGVRFITSIVYSDSIIREQYHKPKTKFT